MVSNGKTVAFTLGPIRLFGNQLKKGEKGGPALKLKLGLLVFGLLAFSGMSYADSIPFCTPGTSITALNQAGGCVAGNLLFSHFQYNNSGLQISPGVYVTPSNVLVTATPFSITFSTDYGLNGGFSNCLFGHGVCIEEEGSLGYDVSVIEGSAKLAGLILAGGGVPGDSDGHVAEISCLGTGNTAHVFNAGFIGYQPAHIPLVCPDNPAAAILLNGGTPPATPFAPASSISVAMSLFVNLSSTTRPHTVAPFSNVLLQAPEPASISLVISGLVCFVMIRRRLLPGSSTCACGPCSGDL
jgi:hypothetical protein